MAPVGSCLQCTCTCCRGNTTRAPAWLCALAQVGWVLTCTAGTAVGPPGPSHSNAHSLHPLTGAADAAGAAAGRPLSPAAAACVDGCQTGPGGMTSGPGPALLPAAGCAAIPAASGRWCLPVPLTRASPAGSNWRGCGCCCPCLPLLTRCWRPVRQQRRAPRPSKGGLHPRTAGGHTPC
jgi:hypothetical protein